MDMRKIISLVEDTFAEKDPGDYHVGECHVFALAAQRMNGWPMVALMAAGRIRGESSFKGCHDIEHVVAVDLQGRMFDVDGYGETTMDWQFQHDKRVDGHALKLVPVTKKDIDKLVASGWLNTYTDDDIAEAETFVARAMQS